MELIKTAAVLPFNKYLSPLLLDCRCSWKSRRFNPPLPLRPNYVVPRIHIQNLSRNPAGEVAAEVNGGVGDFFGFDVALEGGFLRRVAEQGMKIGDAAGGQGVDRSGGNAIDADALGAQLG